jgi:hypothetical protein
MRSLLWTLIREMVDYKLDLLTDILRGFHQALQESTGVLSRLCHYRFYPNFLHFIIIHRIILAS